MAAIGPGKLMVVTRFVETGTVTTTRSSRVRRWMASGGAASAVVAASRRPSMKFIFMHHHYRQLLFSGCMAHTRSDSPYAPKTLFSLLPSAGLGVSIISGRHKPTYVDEKSNHDLRLRLLSTTKRTISGSGTVKLRSTDKVRGAPRDGRARKRSVEGMSVPVVGRE